MDLTNTIWPITWFRIKKHIEKMSESFISFETFKEICNTYEVYEDEEIDTLIDFFT